MSSQPSRSDVATLAHASGHNCCQAVMRAFQDLGTIDEGRISAARSHGGGRAPEGCCGALHAARGLVDPTHHSALDTAFAAHAGALDCRSIRRLRQASCSACVAEATRLAEHYLAQ